MKNIKKNKGFTLIELLVVLALIAVSIGVAGIASSNSASNNLRRVTNAADSMLSRCRINALYRAQPVFVEFVIDGGNVWCRYYESDADGNSTLADEQSLGRAALEITFTVDGEVFDLTRGDPLRISFSRRGALILVDENGAELTDGDGAVTNARLTEIRFSINTTSFVILVTPETGARNVRAG
jgi:prepilin-type N-terminal cleavage/methylation domain-containing protein